MCPTPWLRMRDGASPTPWPAYSEGPACSRFAPSLRRSTVRPTRPASSERLSVHIPTTLPLSVVSPAPGWTRTAVAPSTLQEGECHRFQRRTQLSTCRVLRSEEHTSELQSQSHVLC